MNTYEPNRRQALIAGGMGALSMTMPGSVIGNDKLDSSGNAVAAEKSCIFVLLCGGPSHVDTWDMKPSAPTSIRGPYKPISTKVPGMRINEMHTKLAQVTDQFTLINSMTHPGAISNHFDAMHNLLSGQSTKRVQQGVSDDQPYLGSFVAKHKPSKRNIVSNAWLIKCVGPPVFCAPNIGIGGYLGSAYAPVFVGSATNHPAMENFTPPPIYDFGDSDRLADRRKLLTSLESKALAKDPVGADWTDLREKAYDAMTRPEGREAFNLSREPKKLRDQYGRHPLGQNLLLARRMVEAGVRFVTVNGWTGKAPHDTKGPPSSSWDMHGGNMGMGDAFGDGSYGMGFCLPRLGPGTCRAAYRSQRSRDDGQHARCCDWRVWPHTESSDAGTARTPALAQVFLRHHGRLRHRWRPGVWQIKQTRRVSHQQPCSPRRVGGNDLPCTRYSAQRGTDQQRYLTPHHHRQTDNGIVRVGSSSFGFQERLRAS